MRIHGLDHIVLNVADVERSLAFYQDVLGLPAERLEAWRRGDVPFPSLRVNDSTIIDLLHAEPTGQNLAHFCLVAEENLAEVQRQLEARGVPVEGPPRRLSGARGDALGLFLRDPDGNRVELRSYRG